MTRALTTSAFDEQVTEGEQYVTFELRNETYAMEASKVREIIELAQVTRVPNLPEFFKGVMNLRGAIIPVIDTKMKFGMAAEDYKKHTCIIVAEFRSGMSGLIVDAVSDVLYIAKGSIATAPSFGTTINADFVKGLCKVGEKLMIVLDIDRILTQEETSLIKENAGGE